MTTQSTTKEKFQAEFESLPLEDKYATLFKLEAAVLKDTLNVFVDSSKDFFDKASVAMNDFGSKFEETVTDVYSKVECEVKSEVKTSDKGKETNSESTVTNKTTEE